MTAKVRSRGLPRKVFISSTCFDLIDARAELKRDLEAHGYVAFTSETEDFPVVPGLTPADNCLAVLRECDVYVLIIHTRYGSLYQGKMLVLPQAYSGPPPSVTLAEYLTAVEEGLEIRVWVRDRIWNTNPTRRSATEGEQDRSNLGQVADSAVYDFINYIQEQGPNGGAWINQFHDITDLKESVIHWLRLTTHENEEEFRRAIADLCQLCGYIIDRRTLLMEDTSHVIGKLEDSPFREEDAIWPFFVPSGKPATWAQLRELISTVRDALNDNAYDRAIVIVSSGCDPQIEVQLKRMRIDRRIKVITLDELLEGILPLRSYLERVVHDFENFDFFANPANHSDPVISIMRRCDLHSQYVPLRVKASPSDLFAFVTEWLAAPDRNQLTLLGDFGTGKSSFGLWLTYTLACRIVRQDIATHIPIFVSLRNHVGALDVREIIVSTLVNDYGVRNATFEAFQKLADAGRLLVIFDGFDEIATLSDPVYTLRLLRELNSIVRRYSKVILTCRTHFFRTEQEARNQVGRGIDQRESELFAEQQGRINYEIIHLQEFSPPQISEFLLKHFAGDAKRAESTMATMHDTYNLWDLAKRPVLLEMILKVFPRLQRRMGDQLITPAVLYQEYVQDWIGEVAKGNEELLDPLSKRRFCVGLAKWMYQEGLERLPYAELENAVKEYFRERPIGTYAALDVEIRTCTFLNRDAEGNYQFVHRSFMEFFVAEICAVEVQTMSYDLFATTLLTFEIRNFLRGLVPQTAHYWNAIKSTRNSRDHQGSFVGANAIAMLRSSDAVFAGADFSRTQLRQADFTGCELTGASFRLADLREAAFGNAKLDHVDFRNADLRGIRIQEAREFNCFAWTSTHFFVGWSEGSISMWDCSTWQLSREIRVGEQVYSMTPSPGETMLLIYGCQFRDRQTKNHLLAYKLPDLGFVAQLDETGGESGPVRVSPTALEYVVSIRGERCAFSIGRHIDELEISVRLYNCLRHSGVKTLVEIIATTESEFLRTKNFGRKSLNELKELLGELGLSLGSGSKRIPEFSLQLDGDRVSVRSNQGGSKLVFESPRVGVKISNASYNRDRATVVAVSSDGGMLVWDTVSGAQVAKITASKLDCSGMRLDGAAGLDYVVHHDVARVRLGDWLVARGAIAGEYKNHKPSSPIGAKINAKPEA